MLGLTFHYFHITELLKADYRCTILKALQKNKNIKENLCRIEEYFHDFFFFFRTEVNTHSLLKKQQVVHLLSNGNWSEAADECSRQILRAVRSTKQRQSRCI